MERILFIVNWEKGDKMRRGIAMMVAGAVMWAVSNLEGMSSGDHLRVLILYGAGIATVAGGTMMFLANLERFAWASARTVRHYYRLSKAAPVPWTWAPLNHHDRSRTIVLDAPAHSAERVAVLAEAF